MTPIEPGDLVLCIEDVPEDCRMPGMDAYYPKRGKWYNVLESVIVAGVPLIRLKETPLFNDGQGMVGIYFKASLFLRVSGIRYMKRIQPPHRLPESLAVEGALN